MLHTVVTTHTGACLIHAPLVLPEPPAGVTGAVRPHSLAKLRIPALCQFLACVHQFGSSLSPAFVTLTGTLVTFIATHTFIFAVASAAELERDTLAQVGASPIPPAL